MPGKYNIYNSVISLIILKQMGYKLNRIIKLLSKVNLPSGRMEIVKYKKNIIVIDYAHTLIPFKACAKNGLENIFSAPSGSTTASILVLLLAKPLATTLGV